MANEPRNSGDRPNRRSRDRQPEQEPSGLIERVVFINRCAKVVKGGRRFNFAALVVVGDGKGKVGLGYGKSKEVPDAIKKATEAAGKRMEAMNLRGTTIPHEVFGQQDGGRVMLRPASDGTGVIAGGGVRAVLEAVGVKNILTKSLGSNNHGAVAKSTLKALRQLRTAEQCRALRAANVG